MDLPEDDIAFLCGLVKLSRQRVNHIHWVDRDGSNRNTAVTAVELARINELTKKLGVSKADLLQKAAHIPVAKLPRPSKSDDLTASSA
ncbi:hypothetical protein [Nibricoccus sp. IMCC34717]|uniref:hypothetical protein n=1 Tax=Nibricoccus sp. IMCC34717 TaxID=3034021 RepID=UPI00384A9032